MISYVVEQPDVPKEHLTIHLTRPSCNGQCSGPMFPPWPAPGVSLKQYARERVLAKLAHDGVGDTEVTDCTVWPAGFDAPVRASRKPARPAKNAKFTKKSKKK